MYEHREDMIEKFKTRIDYINIGAYGMGKVNVESFNDKYN